RGAAPVGPARASVSGSFIRAAGMSGCRCSHPRTPETVAGAFPAKDPLLRFGNATKRRLWLGGWQGTEASRGCRIGCRLNIHCQYIFLQALLKMSFRCTFQASGLFRTPSMRLTNFSDYALRLLMYAAAREGELVTIEETAARYGISRTHLMKVANLLTRAGYLTA